MTSPQINDNTYLFIGENCQTPLRDSEPLQEGNMQTSPCFASGEDYSAKIRERTSRIFARRAWSQVAQVCRTSKGAVLQPRITPTE